MDIFGFIVLLVGLAVSIIMIAAQYQLFAIRRAVEALVRLQHPQQADEALRGTVTDYGPATESPDERRTRERRNVLLVVVLVGLAVMVVAAALALHSPGR